MRDRTEVSHRSTSLLTSVSHSQAGAGCVCVCVFSAVCLDNVAVSQTIIFTVACTISETLAVADIYIPEAGNHMTVILRLVCLWFAGPAAVNPNMAEGRLLSFLHYV